MESETSPGTLYAKWAKIYAVKDIGPSGGYIFYVNANHAADGWRYLEAAPASTEWSGKMWGDFVLIDETGTMIGTGESNTNRIADALGAADYAAKPSGSRVCPGGY